MNTHVWETTHQFSYDTPGEVTATALANNLLGLDGVFESGAKVLAMLLESTVKDTEIILTRVELGSYKDNFIFRMVFGEGEEAEKKIEELRRKLRLDKMDGKTLAGFAIAGAIAYGAYRMAPAGAMDDPSVQIHIENSFNALGAELGMGRDEVVALFDTALRGGRRFEAQRRAAPAAERRRSRGGGRDRRQGEPDDPG